MEKRHLNFLWFALLALFWSGSFLGIKITVEQFPPVFCAMIRVALALFFLTIIFLAMRRQVFVPFTMAWRLWLAGLFAQGIPFAFLFYGERFIAPALASILNSTVPIWVLFFNLLFFRDSTQLTVFKTIGLLLSLFGIMVIFLPHLALGVNTTVIGLGAVLIMAFSYAWGAILTQRVFSGKVACPFYASIWQQHCASIVFLIIASLSLEHWPHWHALLNVKTTLAFIYLGLFSTAIAWIIYLHLIRAWDAVRASSVTYITPLLAIIWDYLFLHLVPAWYEFIGVALVLLGVTFVQWQRTSYA